LSRLPLGCFGSTWAKTTRSGALKRAVCSLQCATTSSSLSACPALGTTITVTASPHLASDRSFTATSLTAGRRSVNASTSRLATFSPPVLTLSVLRSTALMQPSLSIAARCATAPPAAGKAG
jgi:hypothetical protein